ncbi:MAG TPA: KUP/HAK/KT family potassium transporter, partial [Polyangiaceae bacterium]
MAASPAVAPPPHVEPHPGGHAPKGPIGQLTLAALGVVFGDIGTSPLYTMHECIGSGANGVVRDDVLGVLSLIFYALAIVVAVKYLGFIMRADNAGEGGILALLALVPDKLRSTAKGNVGWVTVVVLIGTALLYGDGIITPSISVLSAVEGLNVVTDSLKPLILPITVVILIGLFSIQSRGTGSVGVFFGPVMVIWFVTLFVLGLHEVLKAPGILEALFPSHAIGYFARHGFKGLAVLGGVVLAVTGGEALYADMGHFGHRPIRLAWWCLVMPALVVNYFGQGALVLRDPSTLTPSPFFAMVPHGYWTIALVGLASMATVIAS